MKTSEGVMILCVLAAVTLSCESAHQWLNSINDLKKIDFGRSVPKHSLLLLYWFANNINIDQYNSITMTYNPNTDFGSHYYGNFEGLLDPLPRYYSGYRYYTVGNLNDDFPTYVQNPPVREYEGGNLDRIIVSAEMTDSGVYRINQVFLTQHILGTRQYDPNHTYEISTNLLEQIRQFTRGTSTSLGVLRQQFHISDYQLNACRQTWGEHLVCLGLLLFIVIQEKYSRPFTNSVIQGQAGVTQPVYLPNSTYRATQPVQWPPLSHKSTPPDYVSHSWANTETNDVCVFFCMLVLVVLVVLALVFAFSQSKH